MQTPAVKFLTRPDLFTLLQNNEVSHNFYAKLDLLLVVISPPYVMHYTSSSVWHKVVGDLWQAKPD